MQILAFFQSREEDEKEREGKKHCVEFPPKLNQQQFNTYLYSNQLFVYTFKKNATNVTER